MVSFPVFIDICVAENRCKVDITSENTYNFIIILTLLLEEL